MIEGSTLGVFAAAAFLLLITPGPAVLYIVTRSVEQGRRAGLISVLGICTGTLAHVAAAALGISAVIAASTGAFNVLRYLGAAYLIVLGIRTLSKRETAGGVIAMVPARDRRIFAQGVIVNLLNPHTALFFFAFLPQFVNPSKGAVPLQIVMLGLFFVLMSAMTDAVWAIGAGTAGEWIRGNRRFARAQRYVAGCALIGLGAAAAVS